MGKVFIETVGCPKNHEDSERMAGLLTAAGHGIVFDPEEADVIVVNTCGFIEAAKRESIEAIFDHVPYKEKGARLIVTGCLSQRYPEELAAELPEADAVFGVNDYEKLPEAVSALTAPAERPFGSTKELPEAVSALTGPAEGCSAAELPEADAVFGVNDYEKLPEAVSGLTGPAEGPFVSTETQTPPGLLTAPRIALTPRFSSYLKIAEGCSNSCAYCVIPGIRGPYRSVPMERLVAEAEGLAAEGCKELILIAQDVSRYGIDLFGKPALADLLRSLCAAEGAKGIEWIRLLYCHEERVTAELIEAIASEEKIVKYIDLPLQHISDRLLKSMRRVSTQKSIRDTIKRLRAAVPGIAIRTTFITGLPGETEEDFEELYGFVEETRFDRLGVFAYSPEEGTDAAAMPDQVDTETAEARRDALMQLQQRISLENNERLVGAVLDVFVCGADEDGAFHGRTRGGAAPGEQDPRRNAGAFLGRTRGDAPDIDCGVIFSAPDSDDMIGKIVKVRVTDAMDYDLVGERVL